MAVLEAVRWAPHSTAEAVAQRVREARGSASTQAIYDALTALVDAGLVRRIEPAGSPALFEPELGDNHHHLVCSECRRVVDVACCANDAPCVHITPPAGFTVDRAEVTLWGLCSECSSRPSAA